MKKTRAEVPHDRLLDVLAYSPETGAFIWRVDMAKNKCAGRLAGNVRSKTGYVCISIDGVRYLGHRLAWFYMTGAWPSNEIDHIDRQGWNNRWNNLREASRAQNSQNTDRKKGLSNFKGVIWDNERQKWAPKIGLNGKCINLGRFDDIEEAKAARLAAETRLFTHSPRV